MSWYIVTTVLPECQTEPCKHGGTCESSGDGSYTCKCKPGFGGKHCDGK